MKIKRINFYSEKLDKVREDNRILSNLEHEFFYTVKI